MRCTFRITLTALGLAIGLAGASGARTWAQDFGGQTVPVTVQGTDSTASTATDPSTTTTTQSAATTAAATTSSSTIAGTNVTLGNTGVLSQLFTTILNTAWGGVATAANNAQAIGLRIYILIVGISLALALIPVVFGGEPIGMIKFTVERILETSMVVAVISNTWTGIAWFPNLLVTGAAIAQSVVGSNAGIPTFTVSAGWGNTSANELPGLLLNFGGAIFSDIIASTLYTKGGVFSWAQNFFNGTVFVQGVITIIALASACWTWCGFAYAAFRVLISIFKTYLLAPLSIIQGLLGSRRLSSYGGSYFAGAIVFATEICLTFIIAGLFYNIVQTEHSFFQQIYNAGTGTAGTLSGVAVAGTAAVISLAGLIAVDFTTAFFMWALRDVPKLAADAIQGRFTMSTAEAIRAMQSSPNGMTRMVGNAANTLDKASAEGPAKVAGDAVKSVGGKAMDAIGKAAQLAAFVAIGVATDGIGDAVMMGGIMGGGEGAAMSGLGNILGKRFIGGATDAMAEGGGEIGDADSEAEASSEGDDAAKNDEKNTQKTQQQSSTSSDGNTSNGSLSSNGDASGEESDTVTKRVSVETVMDKSGSQGTADSANVTAPDSTITQTTTLNSILAKQLQELTSAIQQQSASTAALAASVAGGRAGGGGGGGADASASGGGGAAGGGSSSVSGGSAGGDASAIPPPENSGGLRSLAQQFVPKMTPGEMFAREMLYMKSRGKTEKPPAPPAQDTSAAVSFNLLGR
jgi:hypothetical protein